MASFQPDRARCLLAGGPAFFGQLEAMVHGIANEMVQRCFKTVEYVTVDAGGLAHHLEPSLLAELSGQVANQPWKATDSISQRPHPAGKNFMVQPARKILAPASEFLDRLNGLSQLSASTGKPVLLASASRSRSTAESTFS